MAQATAAEQTAVLDYEERCEQALSTWWTTADILPHYPASTETVAELVSGNEYDCDRDLILKYLDENIIPMPGRQGGQLRWMAADIVPLTVALEYRRKWRKLSKLHAHKLTQFERLSELSDEGCFGDLANWDLSGLLAILHEPGCNLPARQAVAHAIKAKLKTLGVEA